MKGWLLVITVIFCCACSGKPDEKAQTDAQMDDPKADLLGEWYNISLIIRMPDSTFHVPVGRWEEIMQMKPIRTVFKDDGTYYSEYRTLEDSVFMTRTGTWDLRNDSIAWESAGDTTMFYYKVMPDTITFVGFLDWDQDGQEDDHYASRQVRK
ncbi:MAG: hypothetical protein R3345_02860 [Fulvivirga sp.]|nr:hypothetical protein [Fulvivirga sp.]